MLGRSAVWLTPEAMRRAVLPLVLLGVVLVGCGPTTTVTGTPVVSTITSHVPGSAPAAVVPPAPQPATTVASCPYISTQDAADDNGQHIGPIKVSSKAAGQPHPTC